MQVTKRFSKNSVLFILSFLFLLLSQTFGYEDHSFYSQAFQSERFYRIYLPKDYYKNTNKKYPVIYYFHGWSGRYKWDAYSLTDDANYPANGRKEPPFVMEWKDYTKANDVIIVTWDGYEPKYQPGLHEREGIKFGGCAPYDYLRAHNLNRDIRGWDYKMYFRDLVAHIDSTYRTIANRNNRAISGLSMGGLMSYYIAGQNKDFVNSVSAFCPADNYPLFGIKGQQVVFPILEMHNSLKGLFVRLTMTDGDWLKYNDKELNRLWSAEDLTHFEFHEAHYYDHSVADSKAQLDFHMKHFTLKESIPQSWNNVSPGFPSFKLFGYEVSTERDEPALTIMDKYNEGKLKVLARKFLPDGPIIEKENVTIKTDLLFKKYNVIAYNLSSQTFTKPECKKVDENRLEFTLNGGGNVVGITGEELGNKPCLFILDNHNRDYQYFEEGEESSLDFTIVNIGNKDAENVEITVTSEHPYITFSKNKISLKDIGIKKAIEESDKIKFTISKYSDDTSIGNLLLEIKVNGVVLDTTTVVFFTTTKSEYVNSDDVIVLDGRMVKDIPVFHQSSNTIKKDSLSGGKGNGNGILEQGEEALVFIRIPQGMSKVDRNTYHKTYLLNSSSDKYVEVNKLQYDEKIHQAGATSVSSILTISDDVPKTHEFDLWFRIESLYNDKDDSLAIGTVYAHKYDYRKVKLQTK
jgi:hypothetical protein